MEKEEIKISGMNCGHCIKSVEDAIKQLPVENFEVKMGSLYVEYDKLKIERNAIITAVSDSGYDVVIEN